MSHNGNQLPRPDGINRHFWEMLALLATEPALAWLQEVLSQGSVSQRPRPRLQAGAATARATPISAAAFPPGARPRQQNPAVFHAAEGDPRAAALPRGTQTEQAAAHERTGNRAPIEETFTSQAHSTFRQRLSGPWPLEALKVEMCAGHPKIWKTCNMSLKCFIAFRQEKGLPSTWPLPANQIQGFMVSMDVQGLPPSIIQMYVAALSSMSRLLDFPDPLQDFSTLCMMENLQRQTGVPAPLTMEVLGGLVGSLEEVCSNFYECLLFRAAFVLSFFLALQPEEVAVESCASPHPDLLYMSDCEIQQDSIGLRLCTSETGLERSMYRFARSLGHQLCPVAILHSYLAVRPHGEGPLFMYIDEHPLPRERFLIIFYSALRRLGLPWEQYNMHSFWIGSIVTVVRHRCPGTIIRRLTRWQRRGIRR